MKTIGLIGGISWLSTATYYEILNKCVQKHLGDLHSAKILLYSFDFQEIADLQTQNNWQELNIKTLEIAKTLKNAGADLILICSNTMHKTFDYVEQNLQIPLLHLSDAIGTEIINKKIKKVGLFGTKFTMEQDFLTQRLKNVYHLEIVIPQENERFEIHNNIYNELAKGILNKDSKQLYLKIMNRMVEENQCEGFILGCTEIPLLISSQDTPYQLFDTTYLHASMAVEIALSKHIK